MPHDHADHDHSHDHHDHHHGSGHSHGHAHPAPTNFGTRFLIAAGLNAAFIVAEVIYGFKANSLALLADAGHNFSDVIGLLMAWGAWWLAKKKPQPNFTYGFRGASIVAALLNAILLLVAVGGIVFEAIDRLVSAQQPVEGMIIMAVAGLGIVINGVTAWLFSQGQSDLNIKAAFAHLAADAIVSAAVVVSGGIMLLTHWAWLDPVLSLAVSAVIVWGTWGLLRDSGKLAVQGVPSHIDYKKVMAYLEGLPGVAGVHDLHIWGMSTTEVALTAHLTMPEGHPGDAFLHNLAENLNDRHKIIHVTVQIEMGDAAHVCALSPADVV